MEYVSMISVKRKNCLDRAYNELAIDFHYQHVQGQEA
jgi:hypothetical protein